MNGGELVAKVIQSQGVDTVFTLCGGHISPILVGCKKLGIRVVGVRDEKNAVFAADAWARISGKVGVAIVTAGPGVSNTITALKNAQMAQSPLILIGGSSPSILKGKGALQDVDQMSMVKSMVKKTFLLKKMWDLAPEFTNAFFLAAHGVPGPVFVELPVDVLYPESIIREWFQKEKSNTSKSLKGRFISRYIDYYLDRMFRTKNAMLEGRTLPPPTRFFPPAIQLKRAEDFLKLSNKPLIVIGSPLMRHPSALYGIARKLEKMGIPVYLTGASRGLLGVDSPIQFRHKRGLAMKNADLVILLGVSFDFRLKYGKSIPGKTKVISVHQDESLLNLNRKPTVGILADPGVFVERLSEKAYTPEKYQEWKDELSEREELRETEISGFSEQKVDGINPVFLLKKLDAFLGEDAVLVVDGGDFVATSAYTLRPRTPLSWFDPGPYGTLGVGGGFAMGTKAYHPMKEVWIIYGDGSLGFSMNEFDTFSREGMGIIALVGNDGGWTQIARDQGDLLGDLVGTDLVQCRYDIVANGLGAHGILLEREEDIESAFEEARFYARQGKSVLINAMIGKTDFRKGSISL